MDECIVWPYGKTGKGYGEVVIAGKQRVVHRLMFYLAHGFYPPVVMHSCDNPPCYNPEHLIGGTQADNMRDKAIKGRCTSGVGNRKLSDLQVSEIKKRLQAKKETQAVIARDYAVSKSTIGMISNGSNWK